MKKIFFAGLMLMSFYFGAGNLMFPPVVGIQSGNSFFEATSGFVLTAAALPLIALIASAMSGKKGAIGITNRVNPIFGLIFMVLLYLSIGPLFAIPRAAAFSYDFAISSYFSNDNSIANIIYLAIFFIISYIFTIKGTYIIDTIGKYLSPLLIISITILVIFSLIYLIPSVTQVTNDKYLDSPFTKGILDGYGTLDALASFAFSVIIIDALYDKNENKSTLIKKVSIAGVIAVLLLAIIYFSLSYIGYAYNGNSFEGGNIGSSILRTATTELFSEHGFILFAIIIVLACFTTVVGLVFACAKFFNKIIPIISFNTFAIIISIFSFLISLNGLDYVIKFSVPVLYLLYPLIIVFSVIGLFNNKIKSNLIYQLPVLFTLPFALFDGLRTALSMIDVKLDIIVQIHNFIKTLPLGDVDLFWLIPALSGLLIAILLSCFNKNNTIK